MYPHVVEKRAETTFGEGTFGTLVGTGQSTSPGASIKP